MQGEDKKDLISGFKLVSIVANNTKGFLKYINSKGRTKENIGMMLVEDGHLTNRDAEKVEVLVCW